MQANAHSHDRIGLLFALPEEVTPFRKRTHSSGGTIRIDVSGPGHRNAANHAALLLEQPGPKIRCLLICGFAGGLSPELHPGDLLLADQVLRISHPTLSPAPALLHTAQSLPPSSLLIHTAPLITADRVLIQAAEKHALFTQTHAHAVDMETYSAAKEAEDRGIPWLAIRSITDAADDDLPLDFNALTSPDGSLPRGRILATTLAHPWKIPALIRLGQRSARAAGNLAAFLESLLQTLPE